MTVRILRGLPREHREAAAALYWQAFGGKLGTVMGPEDRAIRFLARAIRGDHAIIALSDEGELLGLAGFKTVDGAFAGGTPDDMRAVYGVAGSLWRAALLRLLGRSVENHRFLMDGICVQREARGLGIGSLLVEAICDEALARGFSEVRLDVIDSNWRARALYERLGFQELHRESIGPLHLVFGFRSTTAMVKRIS